MVVLVVLFGSLMLYRVLGVAGVPALAAWQASARWALATMFAFTAVAHFTATRRDLIAMVPPWLPKPAPLVTVPGALELAGAAGLLIPPLRPWAAAGLMALLVAMFPTNIYAARQELTIRGRPATSLWLRAPMQLLFLLWTWWVL